MAKGRKRPQGRVQANDLSSSSSNSKNVSEASGRDISSGIKAVENLISDADGTEIGSLGVHLNRALESSSLLTEAEKSDAISRLDGDLSSLVGELRSEIDQAKNAKRKYHSQSNELSQREERVASQQEEIERLKKQFRVDQATFEAAQKELNEREGRLVEKERDYESRLIDAEAGFTKQNHELLEKFRRDKEAEQLEFERAKTRVRGEIELLNEELGKVRLAIDDEKQDYIKQLTIKADALAKKEDEIDEERSQLEATSRRLSMREKLLDQKLAADREEIRTGFIAEIERSKRIENELKEQIIHATDKEKEIRKKLASFDRLLDELGGKDPGEIIERMDRLSRRNAELQQQLDLKPSDDLEFEIKRYRQENGELLQERENSHAEIEKLKIQIRQSRVSVIDREGLSKENMLLSKQNELLSGKINDLRSEVDDLLSKQESNTAFPALKQLDMSEEHNRSAVVENIGCLKEFAAELRQRIALDPATGKELFYREEDIRLFLAGLSMSKLHILQGISGTGKTSLAKAFARAVGGGSTTVSVQAGWRDKDDLLGHYNSFEKKFYERPCLKGIYEAQTPSYADRPYIILLDEMNLSRPEQYFAEFLSILELDREDQVLTMMTSPHNAAPKLFINGQYLTVPPNIWFIGTANHDETTFEFADKTYDRAHVMELPRHEERFEIDRHQPTISYSYSSLESAFNKAENVYFGEVTELIDEINHSDFVETLASRMGIGWGNRLERQAHRFVSTMLSSGASKGEALDHLIATKVLRTGKATGRYDTDREDVDKLSADLNALWKSLSINEDATQSAKLLTNELKRKMGH